GQLGVVDDLTGDVAEGTCDRVAVGSVARNPAFFGEAGLEAPAEAEFQSLLGELRGGRALRKGDVRATGGGGAGDSGLLGRNREDADLVGIPQLLVDLGADVARSDQDAGRALVEVALEGLLAGL